MSEAAQGPAAERLLAEARNALARIELAATQLARDACTPAARTLSRGISDAVEDLDAVLTRALVPLRAGAPQAQPGSDASNLLPELVGRLARTLAARGIELEAEAADGVVQADLHLLRRATLALVRAAARVAGTRGRIVVGLRRGDGPRSGIRLHLRLLEGAAPAWEEWLQEPRVFAQLHGGSLECDARGAECEATLWLPSGSPP